ncbi:MAG TPA: histidine kinase dimerization/phospho-acceptor domain-containing protein [Bryobacteraceae bacterium]|nr:histidine kinase dimerization/phospho-acceptor domain-containing protein [Bryobacteraceae bacterium]
MEPGVERVLGYTEPEWLGQHVSIIFSGDDREAHVVDNEMRTAAEQGRCVDLRWHVRKDGTRVYMTGVLRALRDGRGALIGYSKIFLDDTPRKQLEDALTRSNEDLQQFALVASHDLQEPLRTLSGFARLLNQRYAGQLDDEAHKNLAFVLDATERMSRLITDLLAYSQLAREGSRATSVHLDDDLESAISLLRSTVQEADAVITHDALPNVELDRDQMVRVFQNLLGNALKFASRPNRLSSLFRRSVCATTG